jgi:protein-tyrosine kinase
MVKTYEALKWAEKEYQVNRCENSPEHPPARGVERSMCFSTNLAMEQYEILKTNLLSRYPDGSLKTILFTGSAKGNGVSTTVINFAITLAKDSQRGILLLEVNLRAPNFHKLFKIDHVHGLSDLITNNGEMTSPIKIDLGNLYVLGCGERHSEPIALFESRQFDEFLKVMRERFDYVILDAPPVHDFPENLILSSKVDGVILVIESGKTRRHAAIKAKKKLEEAGAKLLGIILNKRKYYIPEFIYKRL